MREYNLYKLPPEILRGTTRIQVLVVRVSLSVLICEIREIRGQKLFHALPWIIEDHRRFVVHALVTLGCVRIPRQGSCSLDIHVRDIGHATDMNVNPASDRLHRSASLTSSGARIVIRASR